MTIERQRAEINGDLRLPAADRVRYLVANLRRNLAGASTSLVTRAWRPPDAVFDADGMGTSSPNRGLTEAFIRYQLAALLPVGQVRVLDVGCGSGSGRTSGLLATVGYCGQYTGVDLNDHFEADRWAGDAFETRFVHGDAHTANLDGPFDLVMSISALEHVHDDGRLIACLEDLLAPGGLQVHFVPAPAALFLYLWHGYRQYGAAVIAERFGASGTEVFKLGGPAGFLLHLGLITLPEIVFRISVRRHWPAFYRALLGLSLRFDAHVPLFSTFYVVCRRARSDEGLQ